MTSYFRPDIKGDAVRKEMVLSSCTFFSFFEQKVSFQAWPRLGVINSDRQVPQDLEGPYHPIQTSPCYWPACSAEISSFYRATQQQKKFKVISHQIPTLHSSLWTCLQSQSTIMWEKYERNLRYNCGNAIVKVRLNPTTLKVFWCTRTCKAPIP